MEFIYLLFSENYVFLMPVLWELFAVLINKRNQHDLEILKLRQDASRSRFMDIVKVGIRILQINGWKIVKTWFCDILVQAESSRKPVYFSIVTMVTVIRSVYVKMFLLI